MTTDTNNASAVLDAIRRSRDVLSARRVFGEPFEIGTVTVIPVAAITGGSGGGGGHGPTEPDAGGGFGTGFAVRARPIGVYKVDNGEIEWKPTVDVGTLAHGAEVLASILAVCVTLVVLRRSR